MTATGERAGRSCVGPGGQTTQLHGSGSDQILINHGYGSDQSSERFSLLRLISRAAGVADQRGNRTRGSHIADSRNVPRELVNICRTSQRTHDVVLLRFIHAVADAPL